MPTTPAEKPFSIKFVSIAGSSSPDRESSTAMITPISPNANQRSPPSPAMEVQLLPLELLSFGYSCGDKPKNCARVINCAHLAAALQLSSPSSSPGAGSSTDGGNKPHPPIDELCSFLVCELQALAVGKSPVRRNVDSPGASPLLSPEALPQLADLVTVDDDDLRLPSPLRPATPPPSDAAALLRPPAILKKRLDEAEAPAENRPSQEPLAPSEAGELGSAEPAKEDVAPNTSLLSRSPTGSSPLLERLVAAQQEGADDLTQLLGEDGGGSSSSSTPLPPPPSTPPPTTRTHPTLPAELEPLPPPTTPPAAAPSRLLVSGTSSPSSSHDEGSPSQRGAASSASASPESNEKKKAPKLRVGIGCKDGQVVSVAIVEHLVKQLANRGLVATARHREHERRARKAKKAALAAQEREGEREAAATAAT